MIITLFRVRIR